VSACLLFTFLYLQKTIQFTGTGSSVQKSGSSPELDTTPDAGLTAATELQTIVDAFAEPYGDRVAVAVIDLKTGATATKNAGTSFVSASIYKLFVANTVYHEIDEGRLSLTRVISTSAGSKSIDACLDVMITVSDNACGEALGTLVGWDTIDELSRSLGLTGSVLNNYVRGNMVKDNATTARDVALLLDMLYRGRLLSKESTEQFIQYLKDDEINQFLPSGLPDGTVIAHKIGYLYGYVHDAGIIYGPNRDVVVVLFTGEWNTPTVESPRVFAQLSSALWDWMN